MVDKPIKRLLIVGNPEEHHIGAHLLAASGELGLEVQLLDVRAAFSKSVWINRFFHRVLKRRPAHLQKFSQTCVELCRSFKPELLLVTGIAAPRAEALQEIGKMGIQRANFLTDDPWNSQNSAAFFWSALLEYDSIWSPRMANLDDLRRHGCKRAEYLPFGYNPKLHFPEAPTSSIEREKFGCDVAIVGGADSDRIPIALALMREGLKIHLYGGYWDKHPELRQYWKGFVHGRELRMAISAATVNIGMVRKANRDGNAMRSLEFPAMGGCMVMADTKEHREIFGGDGECVEYYSQNEDMVKKVKTLCGHPEMAKLLGKRVFNHICHQSSHTYTDRLRSILVNI